MKTKKIIVILSISTFLFLLYFPVLKWLVQSWLHNPYYSHGFIVPVISGVIFWRKMRSLSEIDSSRLVGFLILIFGTGLHIYGVILHFYFLSAISFLILLCGLILYFKGKKVLWKLAFPIVFLIFMIPPPFLNSLISELQSLSTCASTSVLNLIGIPVIRTGFEIHLREATFVVAMPCSGMKSLVSLLFLSSLLAYILKGSLTRRVMLFLLTFPLAIAANILRIVFTILVANCIESETTISFFHDFFGFLFFIVSLLLLVLFSKFLGCSFRDFALAKDTS
jgi:exosortase